MEPGIFIDDREAKRHGESTRQIGLGAVPSVSRPSRGPETFECHGDSPESTRGLAVGQGGYEHVEREGRR